MIVLFVVGLTLAYLIPNARVVSHAKASVALLESEGLYPKAFDSKGLMLDNFTDALMLDIAISDPDESALSNALSSKRQDGRPPLRTINGLSDSAAGLTGQRYSYARYWHGYQVVLRPLLYFFSYGQIRYLNMLALSVLLSLVGISILRTLGVGSLAAFITALLLTGFYAVPMSLQFSSDTYLMLLGVLYVLERERAGLLEATFWETFLVIGALTAFFDLLTMPLITVGMPLSALLLARTRWRQVPVRNLATTSIVALACWGVGFAVSWVAKWVIASRVLGINVIQDAVATAGVRAGSAETGRPVLEALIHNTRLMFPLVPGIQVLRHSAGTAMFVLFLIVVLVLVVWLMATRKSRYVSMGSETTAALKRRAPLLALILLPYSWLAIISQHSVVHGWFTYRTLATAVFVVTAVALSRFDLDEWAKVEDGVR